MPQVIATICNKKGLHARAAAKFVKTAGQFAAPLRVTKLHHGAPDSAVPTVGGSSILGLMLLGADKGTELHLEAEGEDADQALAAIAALIADKFGEEE